MGIRSAHPPSMGIGFIFACNAYTMPMTQATARNRYASITKANRAAEMTGPAKGSQETIQATSAQAAGAPTAVIVSTTDCFAWYTASSSFLWKRNT